MDVPAQRVTTFRRTAIAAGRCLLLGLAVAGAAAGSAQVTGVITGSTVTVRMQPGAKPGDTGLYTFDGPELQGTLGSNAFGSGGTFASTARVDPDGVDFQNGNASGGLYAFTSSHVAIDIGFTNDGTTAVTPALRSSILPAGMGLFIDNPCLDNVAACGPGHTLLSVKDFKQFVPDGLPGPADDIAGASFAFRVMSGDTVLYSLSGSVILAYDPASHGNVLITDFDAAQTALNGFRLTALPGDPSQFGVMWDATDIDIAMPDGTLLAPGASASFTYESTVESFSRTSCFGLNMAGCVVAYSSFGDPVGRGGGIIPNALSTAPGMMAADAATDSSGLTFATFEFKHPVYQDGVVSFDMKAPVVEPATWTLMIAGFALVGLALRRRPLELDHVG